MPNSACTKTVDALSWLDLDDGVSISTGAPANSRYPLSLHDALPISITNALGATLESTGGVLTIDGSNSTFSNSGLLEANGGELDLSNDTLTNSGKIGRAHG